MRRSGRRKRSSWPIPMAPSDYVIAPSQPDVLQTYRPDKGALWTKTIAFRRSVGAPRAPRVMATASGSELRSVKWQGAAPNCQLGRSG